MLAVAVSAVAFAASAGVGAQVLKPCAVSTKEISCKLEGAGGYLYTFTLTNNTGQTVTGVLITPPVGGGLNITPQAPPVPLGGIPNGGSATFQVTITGGQPGQNACFLVTLMSEKGKCCTVEVCVQLPNCCAAVLEGKVTCNKDGSYTYTAVITNTTPNPLQHVYLYPPAGVNITPSYFALAVPVPPGGTFQTPPLTITGAKPGELCIRISFHTEAMKDCCTIVHCFKLPECGVAAATCAPGVCCANAPRYGQTTFSGQKIAAVTRQSFGAAAPSLVVFDMSGANGFNKGTNNGPTKYSGPGGSWSTQNLGTVFGVTIDHLGNIYVAASSAYDGDSFPGGPGRIFKIASGTGVITNFNATPLPNTSDPAIPSSPWPSLGNISFECLRKQFFVTNLDDGRIYRMDFSGNVSSTYDHATGVVSPGGAPEPGDAPGFAPLGERLWAVQAHNNRVYYSVWREDAAHRSAAVKNEIWSIGLNIVGEFDPADRRLEVAVPDFVGTDFSSPTADISFSPRGSMLLAERSMFSATAAFTPTDVDAHGARVLEYACAEGVWTPSPPLTGFPYKYNVGIGGLTMAGLIPSTATPANSAGGIDYDFDPLATFGVWATGDALSLTAGLTVYGLQGFPLGTGGAVNSNPLTTPLVDLDGNIIAQDKMHIGDVEVSCPPNDNAY